MIKPYVKYKIGDTVVVGCGNGEAAVKIHEYSLETYLGKHAKYDTDINYVMEDNTGYNPWKYGSSGGGFTGKHFLCSFEEKYILKKVSE